MANLALRFLLELCALVAVGYWGFHTGPNLLAQIGFGLGAPLLMAVIWGVFGSPRASMPLAKPLHLLLEVVVFGSAGVALFAANRPNWAWLYLVLFVGNRLLIYVWGQ